MRTHDEVSRTASIRGCAGRCLFVAKDVVFTLRAPSLCRGLQRGVHKRWASAERADLAASAGASHHHATPRAACAASATGAPHAASPAGARYLVGGEGEAAPCAALRVGAHGGGTRRMRTETSVERERHGDRSGASAAQQQLYAAAPGSGARYRGGGAAGARDGETQESLMHSPSWLGGQVM